MRKFLMMTQSRPFLIWGLLLTTISLVGCSGGSTLPEGDTGTVKGKVTHKGNPVPEGASIVFLHKDKGITASSAIAADGKYALKMRRGDQILVGDYQIGITPPTEELTPEEAKAVNEGKELPKKEWPQIPEIYRNPETSGVKFTVKAGENTFDLDMK